MTKRSITSLVIKLAAIYSIAISLPNLIRFFNQIFYLYEGKHYEGYFTLVVGSTLLFALMPVLCLFLIRSSDRFATWLIESDEQIVDADKFSPNEIQSIAFSCVGLLVLSTSIPSLINSLMQISALGGMRRSYPNYLPSIMSTCAEIFIGLYLFFYPKSILRLRSRIMGKAR